MLFEKMSLTNALYFSIATMATVGYGDLHPQTEIGKFLALIIIIGGVGTCLGVIASITDLFVNRREEAVRQQNADRVTGLFFSEMGNALLKHIENDIMRVYKLLLFEWLRYIRHLKMNYGYLFSLAIRINPFDPEATAVVKKNLETA